MKLQNFIRDSLLSIKNGLREANLEIAKSEGKTLGKDIGAAFILRPDQSGGTIDFDVAVTISSESKAEGGAGIEIAIAKLGGDLSASNTLQNVSRIKFSIKSSLITG